MHPWIAQHSCDELSCKLRQVITRKGGTVKREMNAETRNYIKKQKAKSNTIQWNGTTLIEYSKIQKVLHNNYT